MLDAHLAGMKAALKLTPDQEKNWAAFEASVRDAAQARRDAMRAMRDAARGDERLSPIERMNAMADRLAKASTEIKAIAAAAKPLYDSLDDGQRRHFGPLMATLIEHGPHRGAMIGPGGMMMGPHGNGPARDGSKRRSPQRPRRRLIADPLQAARVRSRRRLNDRRDDDGRRDAQFDRPQTGAAPLPGRQAALCAGAD